MDIKNYYEILAQNIKIERVKGNITQQELANRAGLSRDTISQIERGIANPTLETIISIAKALNVDLNTLLPLK